MIAPQRVIHRLLWVLLTPLLLGLILYFSQPETELSPANAETPALPGLPALPGTGLPP